MMLRVYFPLLALLAACDVPPAPPSTGGAALPDGPCGRGVVVLGSNYGASNVALLDLEGQVRSPSLLSSGASSAGLSLPLSGDVVAPTDRTTSGELLLLDRFPNAVLTWINPASGAVRAQLSVATGFASNPQDYLEVAPGKAYVTRQNPNPAPGSAPFDGGNDVLVIDPRAPAITGRIALPEQAPYLARPARMTRVGSQAWAPLLRMDADFKQALDGAVLALDPATDQELWRRELPGLANCGTLARSPAGDRVAVACSGVFAAGPAQQLARSGVVVLDTASPPAELLRVSGASLGGPPAFASMAFAGPDRLLVPLYGDTDQGRPDQLVLVDLPGGKVRVIYRAISAFVLGDVRCVSPCAGRCFFSDAEGPGVRWLTTDEQDASIAGLIQVAPERGLPPRNLGSF